MNPELQRNLWLELTPRRMLLMAALLALAFFAASLPGDDRGPSEIAFALYIVITVAWGVRNASLSVLGEIRDRTWDAQRLSSLSPAAMMWGKLIGATSYNWFGGILCLVVILAHTVTREGVVAALMQGIVLVAVGVIAQATALLASLVGIRRKKTYGRLDISIYQAAGFLAGMVVYFIWDRADIIAAFQSGGSPEHILWWGMVLPEKTFLIVSLAIFVGWTLLGCYRLMRLELKVQNGPLVWALFLLFMGIYAAGFDAWLSDQQTRMLTDAEGPIRLGLASFVFVLLTYWMVFLEPKDRVHYRWLVAKLRKGVWKDVVSGLHGWMMSYGAALVCGLVLIVWLGQTADPGVPLLVLAMLGFLTRDIAIVLLMSMRGKGRGDFGALALLAALYFLAPMIVGALGLRYLFWPTDDAPLMAAVAACVEAGIVVTLAARRMMRMEDV